MSTTLSLDGSDLSIPTANDTSWDRNLNATLTAAIRRLDKTAQIINIKSYGAVCDGSTDDSSAIQAAVNACEEAGGGVVEFPPGTIRCNFLVGDKVVLRGQGRATILKAVAGSNAAVIQGKNFATLTGKSYASGDINAGDNYVRIEDLTVDGDKANQASGWGIRIWGRSLSWRNLVVQNCKSGCIWTEFTTHDGGTVEDLIESTFENIKTSDSDGDGWEFRGPHDSFINGYVGVGHTGWALKTASAASSYNGVVSGRAWNSWLNGLGSYYFGVAPGCLSDSIASGETGTGIELASGTGSGRFSNITIGGHETGLILRGSNHRFTGVVSTCTADGIVVDGATYCVVAVTGTSNENAVDWVSGGRLNFEGNFELGGGSLSTGTPPAASFINLVSDGGFAFRLPSRSIVADGWTPVLPQSNGVLAVNQRKAEGYSASITPSAFLGSEFVIDANNGSAFTINAISDGYDGQRCTIRIRNTSGGALGTATWTGYKMAAWTQPADGFSRAIEFIYNGTSWVEVSRTPADVPN